MIKQLVFSLSFFLFIFISSSFASAVGIGGAVGEFMFFEPNLEKEYSYDVLSNTDRVMDHLITLNGDLSPYFTISTNVLKDLAPGETANFTAKMKLPPSLDPGNHKAVICAEEAGTRGNFGKGPSIGSKARVCAVITVFVPYSGKHVKFEFIAPNVNKGEKGVFKFLVTNMGTEEVDIYGDIEIEPLNIQNAKEINIITLQTQHEHLETSQKATLNATLDTTDLEIGEYNADATLHFSGDKETDEKIFRIGDLYMKILNFTEEITKGRLSQIKVNAKSIWNSPIEGVYASLEISNPDKLPKKIIVNTPPVIINQWETKELTGYLDTSNMLIGEYDLKITLHYEDKITVKEGKINLKPASSITIIWLIIFVAALIILILILFIIKLLRRQEDDKHSKANKRIQKEIRTNKRNRSK